MRLTEFQQKTIKESVSIWFGENSSVYLFGSIVDDNKKGGDIDLLIITSVTGTDLEYKKMVTKSKIQCAIGDQKIDMITAEPGLKNPSLIIQQALKGTKL